jgi:hypothetical protein
MESNKHLHANRDKPNKTKRNQGNKIQKFDRARHYAARKNLYTYIHIAYN